MVVRAHLGPAYKEASRLKAASSFVFATNAFHGVHAGQSIYGGLFVFLWFTSVLYHGTEKRKSNLWRWWIDQLAIGLLAAWGTYVSMRHLSGTIHWATVLFCMAMCALLDKCAPEKQTSVSYETDELLFRYGSMDWGHVFIHLFGSAGHHIVIAAASGRL